MTTGALLFAYNTEHIDYLKIASWCASNIKRHLGIPVAVVTDQQTHYDFDKVIIYQSQTINQRWFGDLAARVPWRNDTRPMAYSLTPWDRTLVLDVDYVVASDQLKSLLDADCDFLAHRRAYDITGQNDFGSLNHFGDPGLPMWWATVMMFDRTDRARMIFDAMLMVRDNWSHYKNLLHINSSCYRNDHALSIALNLVNGHDIDHPSIPWALASLIPDHRLCKISQDHYRVDFVNSENKNRWTEIKNQDFHAMGKTHLEAVIADNA